MALMKIQFSNRPLTSVISLKIEKKVLTIWVYVASTDFVVFLFYDCIY
jgi:hypothetical protein